MFFFTRRAAAAPRELSFGSFTTVDTEVFLWFGSDVRRLERKRLRCAQSTRTTFRRRTSESCTLTSCHSMPVLRFGDHFVVVYAQAKEAFQVFDGSEVSCVLAEIVLTRGRSGRQTSFCDVTVSGVVAARVRGARVA